MTIQQQLANRLYELLPHKKELEFGCQFIWKEDLKDKNGYCAVFENWVSKEKTVRCLTRPFFTQAVVEISHITETIGQPLRLADLLLAIGKQDLHYIKMWVSDNTDNHMLVLENPETNTRVKYNLQDDNILNQSNELCEFALDLLK